jgi:hypothetical protein
VKPRAFLVVALLSGLFAPRWLPQPLQDECCCPAAMHGACSRTSAECSVRRCMPQGAVAISLSAPRLFLPAVETLPAPSAGDLLVLSDAEFRSPPPADPSDPPPRFRA